MHRALALLPVLPTVLLGGAAISWAWGVGELYAVGEARLLTLCITLLWAWLLIPAMVSNEHSRLTDSLAISVLVALAGLVLAWWIPSRNIVDLPVLQAAAGIGLMTFAAGGLAQLLAIVGVNAYASWLAATFTAALLGLAPLWLGPVVDMGASDLVSADLVVTLSPMSHIATLLDWDFLRSEWFYQHSPFGGLRYDYPNPVATAIVYLAIGLAGHLLLARARQPDTFPKLHDPLTL